VIRTTERIKKLEDVLYKRQPDITVVIENVHDPHNVSAILRSCDASGVYEVQLLYTKEKFPIIDKKSSASASKWIKRRLFKSIDECYGTLHREGFVIYATNLGQEAKDLYKIDLTKKVAIVFGNEHRGVSEEAAEKADALLKIQQVGLIQSLNVSVACAVVLFEVMRQRMVVGAFEKPKLSSSECSELLKEWIKK